MTSYWVYSFFLMLISPIFTVIQGLKINSYPIQRGILILGITFYGSTIAISPGNDGYRHQKGVERYEDMSMAQFLEETKNILTFQKNELGAKNDLYIHLLSFFTGRVLGIPRLFFIFVSFVYAFFFSGSILKVVRLLPDSVPSSFFYALATIFVLYKNVEGINTVRTWTGLWVLFYGAINYFETRKLKYLLLCFVPPLIHLGYFVMAIPAWLALLFGWRFRLIFVILYVLSFVTILPQSEILEQSQENELAANKVDAYYVEDIEEFNQQKIRESATFYRNATKQGLQDYGVHILIISSIMSGMYFRAMNNKERGLFSIGILEMALSNWTPFLFALNSRSAVIGGVFITGSLVLFIKRIGLFQLSTMFNKIYVFLFFIAILIFIPFFIFQLSDILHYISIFMIALPFVAWFSGEVNFSIREFLGWFINK